MKTKITLLALLTSCTMLSANIITGTEVAYSDDQYDYYTIDAYTDDIDSMKYFQFFIDMDNNPNTGYTHTGIGVVGADLMLEGKRDRAYALQCSTNGCDYIEDLQSNEYRIRQDKVSIDIARWRGIEDNFKYRAIFLNSGWSKIGSSPSNNGMKSHPSDVQISSSKSNYSTDEDIWIELKNKPNNVEDWIGIYPASSNNDWSNVADWRWANSGDWYKFTGLGAGEYEARFFLNNSFVVEDSTSFSVGESRYKPAIGDTWQWQLQGSVNTSYDVDLYDVDLFDSSASFIQSLHNSGKKVICYFSAGSYEEWRDDAALFDAAALGNTLDGWEGEKWLDIRHESLKEIMKNRLDLAVEKGCNGVEPDNMDGYINSTGFTLSAEDQLEYNKFIANEARKRGLSVGLKNDLDQIVELEPFFDFAVNEECHFYEECDKLQPFIDANKPVFHVEYAQKYVDNINGARDAMCAQSRNLQFQTLVLPLDLDDSFRFTCD